MAQHLSFQQLSNLSKPFLELPILATIRSVCPASLLMGFTCVITFAETLLGGWLSTQAEFLITAEWGQSCWIFIKPSALCTFTSAAAGRTSLWSRLTLQWTPPPVLYSPRPIRNHPTWNFKRRPSQTTSNYLMPAVSVNMLGFMLGSLLSEGRDFDRLRCFLLSFK